MISKYVVYSTLFCVVLSNQYREMKEVYENHQEWPCLSHGGLCVKSGDCPADKRSPVKGLCPVQQKDGYECCHAVAQSKSGCKANGGECVSKSFMCPPYLTFNRATDCKPDERCCVFVR